MSVKFLASTSPAALAATKPHITVEAEYGDLCVSGSAMTMAHHGPRAGQRCPAAYTTQDVTAALRCGCCGGCHAEAYGDQCQCPPAEVIVGLSHFDLDTLGGCMAVLEHLGFGPKVPNQSGFGPHAAAFWALAEFVDTHGPHRLAEGREVAALAALRSDPGFERAQGEALAEEYSRSGGYPAEYGLGDFVDMAFDALHAFWAWGASNRGPRVTAEVVDLTDHVLEAARIVRVLLDPLSPQNVAEATALRNAGRAFAAAESALRESSLVAACGPVALRVAEAFTNHLYLPLPGAAVVAYNPKMGTVTVSFADGAGAKFSAVEIVQSIWGPLAGGHKGIAGSPRDRKMTLQDAEAAFSAVCALVGA